MRTTISSGNRRCCLVNSTGVCCCCLFLYCVPSRKLVLCFSFLFCIVRAYVFSIVSCICNVCRFKGLPTITELWLQFNTPHLFHNLAIFKLPTRVMLSVLSEKLTCVAFIVEDGLDQGIDRIVTPMFGEDISAIVLANNMLQVDETSSYHASNIVIC